MMEQSSSFETQENSLAEYLHTQPGHQTCNQPHNGSEEERGNSDDTYIMLQLVLENLYQSPKSAGNGYTLLTKRNPEGKTPIMLASERRLSATLSEMLSFASAEEKASILLVSDDNGFTALHWAVLSRDVETIESIKHSIADQWDVWYQLVCSVDNNGCTAVHLATKVDVSNAISSLLEGYGQMQMLMILKAISKDKRETAIHYAASKPECMRALMKCVTDPEDKFDLLQAMNHKKETVLHLAAESSNWNMEWHGCIALIIQSLTSRRRFEFLSSSDGTGSTALHIATAKDDLTTAAGLLELTPIRYRLELLQFEDSNGSTPIDIAQMQTEDDILLWIECYKAEAVDFIAEQKKPNLSGDEAFAPAAERDEEELELQLDYESHSLGGGYMKLTDLEISEVLALDNIELRRENREKTEEILCLRQQLASNQLMVTVMMEKFEEFKNIHYADHVESTAELKKDTEGNKRMLMKLQATFDAYKAQNSESFRNLAAAVKKQETNCEAKNHELRVDLERCKQMLIERGDEDTRNAQNFRIINRILAEYEELGDRRFEELWRSSVAREKQTGTAIGISRCRESSLQEQIKELCRRALGDGVSLLSEEVHS